MEHKKESAEQFIEMARAFINYGHIDKATSFLLIAEQIYPSESAKRLLKLILNVGYKEEQPQKRSVEDKDNAERSLVIAQKAFDTGDIAKAEYYSLKAERLYPSENAKDLLRRVRVVKYGSVIKNNRNVTKEALKSDPKAQTPTAEQIEVIRLVNAAKDDYQILGLPQGSPRARVRKAYLRLLHSDKNRAPGSEEAFMTVTEANERLKLLHSDKNRASGSEEAFMTVTEANERLKLLHSDKNRASGSEETFMTVTEANERLKRYGK